MDSSYSPSLCLSVVNIVFDLIQAIAESVGEYTINQSIHDATMLLLKSEEFKNGLRILRSEDPQLFNLVGEKLEEAIKQ